VQKKEKKKGSRSIRYTKSNNDWAIGVRENLYNCGHTASHWSITKMNDQKWWYTHNNIGIP
jgi:hypothetical protein